MIELAFLAVVSLALTGGLLLHLERKDRRHGQTVQFLLQRIQDPQAAVVQHAIQTVTPDSQPVAHLPFDDDEAWMKYVESLEPAAD